MGVAADHRCLWVGCDEGAHLVRLIFVAVADKVIRAGLWVLWLSLAWVLG